MPNKIRGEVEATLSGKTYTLCLTLGALAELESAFECETLIEVIERFQSGNVKAQDLITVIAAGLKGAGHEIKEQDVAMMQIEGGVKASVSLVSELFNSAFNFEDHAE